MLLIDTCASKETNMENDLSKYFVPGMINYTSRYVEAFKALICRDKGVRNSDNEVLINLNSISSIEKRQFRCGVYSKGPIHDFWTVHIQNSAHYYEFEYHTGLAIVLLWKRHFREGGYRMEKERPFYEKQLKGEQDV
tara:strand:- start:1556 stop:1966 length:411 start_codon:yes stop_codon:yes gene_type:complete